ncbi:MAG: hypothetical protein GY696_23635 [Gammaproteobacteria bacterium]|nr:hypothetical protein [Gammaproteobacteria bacterium]
MSRVQMPTETVFEYAHALADLFETGYPQVPIEQLDCLLRDRFTSGVLPVYQGWLRFHTCDTYQAAVACARKAEITLQSNPTASLTPALTTEAIPERKTNVIFGSVEDGGTRRELNELRTGITSVVNAMNEVIESSTKAINEGWGRGQSQGGNRGRMRLEFTNDGRPICLYCKKAGHIRKDCRQRRADFPDNIEQTRDEDGGQTSGYSRGSRGGRGRGAGKGASRGRGGSAGPTHNGAGDAGFAQSPAQALVDHIQGSAQETTVINVETLSAQVQNLQDSLNHLALAQYPNMNCIDVTGSGHMSEGEESDEPEIELYAEGTLEEEDTEEISPLELEEPCTEEVLTFQGMEVESPVMTTPPEVKHVKSARNPSRRNGPWNDEFKIPRIKNCDIGHQWRHNRPKLTPGKHIEPVSIDGVKD